MLKIEQIATRANTDQLWIATFNSPIIGIHHGQGSEAHLAVIALANVLMEYVKPKDNVGKFGEYMQRALNQPSGKWPFLEPMHPSDIPPIEQIQGIPGRDRIEHVGRIVWYTPGSDDCFGGNDGVLPAIITRAWEDDRMDINIFAFSPGIHLRSGVEYSHIPKPGTWCWPKTVK